MPTTIVGILVAIVVAFGVMFLGGMDPIGIFFGDPMSACARVRWHDRRHICVNGDERFDRRFESRCSQR